MCTRTYQPADVCSRRVGRPEGLRKKLGRPTFDINHLSVIQTNSNLLLNNVSVAAHDQKVRMTLEIQFPLPQYWLNFCQMAKNMKSQITTPFVETKFESNLQLPSNKDM